MTKLVICALLALMLSAEEPKPRTTPLTPSETQRLRPEPATARHAPESRAESKPNKVSFTLGELINAQPSLMKLFNADLPIKTAWSLSKSIKSIEAELKRYEEQRQGLVKKYVGDAKEVPQDKMTSFLSDLKTLQEIKVEVEVAPIRVDSLADSVKFSSVDMMRLEKFFSP